MIEVIAALSLMAALAAISANRFHSATVSSVGNAVTARSFVLEIARARRLAILNGESHGIRFIRSRDRITSYVLFRRRASSGLQLVEKPRQISNEATVSFDRSVVEFNAQGNALKSCRINFRSPGRTWRIDVVPVTGRAILAEIDTKRK